MSWSSRRKAGYGIVLLLPFVIISGIALYAYLNHATCFDGKMNGDEKGIDCDGSCIAVCKERSLAPVVLWTRPFHVSGSIYNVVSMIENPNLGLSAQNIPYQITLYDADNVPIVERTGSFSLAPGVKFPLFESGISTGDRVPSRATIELTADPVWRDAPRVSYDVQASEEALSDIEGSPRLDATIENNSSEDLKNVQVVAVLYDENRNAIHSSRTLIDDLPQRSSAPVVFTWPEPFPTGEGMCEMPTDVVIATDRSGSMDSDGEDPPEPLTSVKSAARAFVSALGTEDRVAVVSFAGSSSDPIDASLTFDHDAAETALGGIAIKEGDESGTTNIGAAIAAGLTELTTRTRSAVKSVKRVIVLLTDGQATSPAPDPEGYALDESAKAAEAGIELYTIGLGVDVNESFLTALVPDSSHYYNAPDPSALGDIYKEIATSICNKGPYVIEIIPIIEPSVHQQG